MDILNYLTSRLKLLENNSEMLKCASVCSRLNSLESDIKSLKQRVSAIEAKLLMSAP